MYALIRNAAAAAVLLSSQLFYAVELNTK